MTRAQRGPRAVVCLVIALLAAATAVQPAVAAPSTKYYSATPAVILAADAKAATATTPATAAAPAVVVLTSCKPCDGKSSTQPFGSAEVSLARGAGLDGARAAVVTAGSRWTVTVTEGLTETVLRLTNPGPGTTYAVTPGTSISLSLPVTPGRTSATVPLTTRVKQSNDFSGTGNDVTRVGPDPVVYVGAGPPASLRISASASSVQVESGGPSGGLVRMCPPPKVEVLDAQQRRVTWLPPTAVTLTADGPPLDPSSPDPALSATRTAGLRVDGTVQTRAGEATFGAPSLSGTCTATAGDGSVSAGNPGRGYTLRASLVYDGRTLNAADSATFDVLPYYVPCPGSCATPDASSKGTTASVSAVLPAGTSSSAGALTFGVGFDTWDPSLLAACNPDAGGDPTRLNDFRSPVTVDLADHDKTVQLRWSKQAVQWATNNGSSQWGVCMAAAYAFPTAAGPDAVLVGGWYVGALPRCGAVVAGSPCVASLTRQSGEQLATVTLPDRPGDPRMI